MELFDRPSHKRELRIWSCSYQIYGTITCRFKIHLVENGKNNSKETKAEKVQSRTDVVERRVCFHFIVFVLLLRIF